MQYVLTPYAEPIEPWAWWEKAFTEQELDWLQDKAMHAEHQAQVGGNNTEFKDLSNIRRSTVSWLTNTPDTQWVFEKLATVVSSLNSQFYRFDLTGFGEPIQLTHYDQSDQGMYGWHQDYGGSASSVSRKLSIVLQLTDPAKYEGGNLQIKTSGQPSSVRKQRGLIAAFPSYTLHQVTPVTNGSRQSLVAWISGPAFR
jgi:PKHD-type hydroxylase